jgi:trimethylamine:corrinoid methyltransferase-like protein
VDGARDIREIARARAKEILAMHKPEPLEKDVEKELAAIVREAEKMYG